MVSVPGFLLRRLYLKGSLRNTADGFEFQLKNNLGSGYAHKVWPMVLDGTDVPLDGCSFEEGGRRIEFAAVSKENTLTLAMNKAVTVMVQGATLEPGPRKVGMAFDVPGLGTLKFDFTDLVSDE